MKRLLPLAVVMLLAGVALSVGVYQQYRQFLVTPLQIETGPRTLQVERGSSVRGVIRQLDDRGITRLDWRWKLLTRLNPVTIRAGEYALHDNLYPADLLALLASGDVVRYHFTIIEGWTYAQLREALRSDPVLVQTLDTRFDLDEELLETLGGTGTHAEGWFLPETYQFVRGDSDFDILKRAHEDMLRSLAEAWQVRKPELPLDSPYALLTLASIVEKESALESERARIAGVLVRRLQQRWRLETDPTVIYGLGENFDGDIRTKDLRTDNPYNTYTRYGLPPTPIALPARSALFAAAQPEDGTAMFFVADGKGGHQFSDTLKEHNKAVKDMLRRNP